MNVKLKFALLFAIIVSALLIISSVLTYYLFANHRKEDFRKRLNTQAIFQHNNYVRSKEVSYSSFTQLLVNAPASLVELQTVYLDSSLKPFFYFPASLKVNIDSVIIKKADEKKGFFDVDEREGVALKLRDKANRPYYLILSAYDRYGKRKQSSLKLILSAVSLGGILLSGLFAFFYISQFVRPIRKITDQIQIITETNLQERVKVPEGFSELASMAANFNKMLDRLQHAFELQKSFVHHASHELRTPLAIMLSQTEAALRRELSNDELRKVLNSLKEDQQEMIELTNSLLLLSQFEKVSFSSDWPLIRIDEIIYDSVSSIKRIFPAFNVSVDFKQLPDDELFLTIPGNDALLRSAIRNLLKNAYTYSDDKFVSILIDVEDNNYKIIFENKGNIVPWAEQEKLFLPFFRAENAQQKRGFGLGLSIVQRIALLHRGRIEYHSEGTNSNQFILYFPKK